LPSLYICRGTFILLSLLVFFNNGLSGTGYHILCNAIQLKRGGVEIKVY